MQYYNFFGASTVLWVLSCSLQFPGIQRMLALSVHALELAETEISPLGSVPKSRNVGCAFYFSLFFPRENLWAECLLLTVPSIVRLCLWWWGLLYVILFPCELFLTCRFRSVLQTFQGIVILNILLHCFSSSWLQLYQCRSFFVLHLTVLLYLLLLVIWQPLCNTFLLECILHLATSNFSLHLWDNFFSFFPWVS